MSSPTLSLSGVSKSFGNELILLDVEIHIAPGAVVGLVGANGSGKSTLLRIAAGLVVADRGTVSFDGSDVVTMDPRRRSQIGTLLADERAWYWRLTGRENLEFFAALHRITGVRARAAINNLAERVGLGDALGKWVGAYSSGMRLRLALARALLPEPRLLLLDEPTRSADATAGAEFCAIVREQAEGGVAVLLASHDGDEIGTLATDVILLHKGRPPERLEDFQPRDLLRLFSEDG